MKGLHRFTVLVAGATFVLIIAGALVTSNDAGLGAIFEYLSDCAAAFGTSEPMLISSTRIVQPQAMMLIIFSLIILSVITLALVILAFIFLSPMAALIAMSPFAVAAHSPL